jgi:hypothetical protein
MSGAGLLRIVDGGLGWNEFNFHSFTFYFRPSYLLSISPKALQAPARNTGLGFVRALLGYLKSRIFSHIPRIAEPFRVNICKYKPPRPQFFAAGVGD